MLQPQKAVLARPADPDPGQAEASWRFAKMSPHPTNVAFCEEPGCLSYKMGHVGLARGYEDELVHRLLVLRRRGTAGGMRQPGSKFTLACPSDPGSLRAHWSPQKEAAPHLGGLPFDVRPGRVDFRSVTDGVRLGCVLSSCQALGVQHRTVPRKEDSYPTMCSLGRLPGH